ETSEPGGRSLGFRPDPSVHHRVSGGSKRLDAVFLRSPRPLGAREGPSIAEDRREPEAGLRVFLRAMSSESPDRFVDIKHCLAQAEEAFVRAGRCDDPAERARLMDEAEAWLVHAERAFARLND